MYRCSYAELGSTVSLVRHLTQLAMHIQSVQPNRHSITDYKPACYISLWAMGWPDLTVSPTLCMYITVYKVRQVHFCCTDCQFLDDLTTWLLDTTKVIMTGPAKTGHICTFNFMTLKTCSYLNLWL